MIRNKHGQYQICQKHNLPLEFLNPDKQNRIQLYVCTQCIIEYYQPIPIQQIQQSNQKVIEQFEQQLNQNSNIWNVSIHSLISLKEAFIKSIKNIENIIDVIRNQILQTTNQFSNVNIKNIESIKTAHESYLQTQFTHQRNIIQQIQVLKQNSSIDKIIIELNEINLQILNYEDQKQQIKIVEIQKKENIYQLVTQSQGEQLRVKKYEYQLILESSFKQNGDCFAISLNYDGSIIVAGWKNLIKVFEFKNTQLKKVQSLEGVNSCLTCLKFMNRSNYFISGDFSGTIKIWQVNNQNQWINIQTLKEHKDCINSIIINQNDYKMVSGSDDKSIIFWGLNDNKWQLDQQIKCSSVVYSLSFNDSNTKLISCEDDKLIQVFEQKGNKWINSQKIQAETEEVRLCFINDDQFAFLPWKGKSVQFYKLYQQTNKFEKQYQVQVSNGDDIRGIGFPMKFIKSKNLLIVKNCQFINVLSRQQHFDFIKEQSIEFKTQALIGDVSHDGNFMVTYDWESKQYQVRLLREEE